MFDYQDENPLHRAALAAAILSIEAEDVVQYPSECLLTRDAEAKVLAVLAAGCVEGARGDTGRALRFYRDVACVEKN